MWQSPLTAVRAIAIFCFTPTPAATAAHNVPAVSLGTEGGREGGRRGEQAQVFVEDEFNSEAAKSEMNGKDELRQMLFSRRVLL